MAYIIFSLTAFGAIFDKKYYNFSFSIFQFCSFNSFSPRKYGVYLELIRCLFYLIFDYFVIQNTNWNSSDENLNPNFNTKQYSIAFGFVVFVRLFHISSILFWLFRILFTHQGIYDVQMNVKQTVNSDPETPQIDETQNGNGKNQKRKWNLHLLGSNIQIIIVIISANLMAIILTAAMFFQTDQCLIFYNDLIEYIP